MAVQDGPQMVTEAGDLLAVGFSGPLDPYNPYDSQFIDSATDVRQGKASGLNTMRDELISLSCVMFAVARDTQKDCRDFLYGRLSALDDAMRADMTLGGLVLQASLAGDHRLIHRDSSSGWSSALVFSVTVRGSV
jgi:hypothetical protein